MITELTKEQRDLIQVYFDEGLKYGLMTQDGTYDDTVIRPLVDDVYRAFKLNSPEIHYAESPRSANQLVNRLLHPQDKSQWNKFNRNYMAGNQELFWLQFYSYINDVLPVQKTDLPLAEMTAFCKQVGWFWPEREFIVISRRPIKIYRRNERSHNPNGAAVEYSDGFKVWSINGVQFTGDMIKFVETPKEGLDAKEVLNIKNVEQRAEIINKFGIDRLFYDLKPEKLDSKDGYELYSVKLYEDSPRIYLKMQNPSIDEIHIEAVHPDCKSVAHALSWRNFGEIQDVFVPPRTLT